jgi:hypothetical protein
VRVNTKSQRGENNDHEVKVNHNTAISILFIIFRVLKIVSSLYMLLPAFLSE